MEPKKAIIIQENIVSKNASLILILLFFCLKEKYKTIPIKKVMKLENEKTFQSSLWYKASTIIGTSIEIASIQSKKPIMEIIDLKSLIVIIISV